MGLSLTEIAEQLRNNNKKVQLIYAFNGVGKTRLSREFKELIQPKNSSEIEQIIEVLNIADANDRSTNDFDHLKYIFIDDPVTSLDENHLIELAVDLAQLIKSSKSDVKFIITTHNPLFYNVLYNELKRQDLFLLKKLENGEYELTKQEDDSPFSYHLYLKKEIENAIENGHLKKYHYIFLRNILEKTATFLGYKNWSSLLPNTNGKEKNPYETRMINILSHSKHTGEEVANLSEDDKRVLKYLIDNLNKTYHFNKL